MGALQSVVMLKSVVAPLVIIVGVIVGTVPVLVTTNVVCELGLLIVMSPNICDVLSIDSIGGSDRSSGTVTMSAGPAVPMSSCRRL